MRWRADAQPADHLVGAGDWVMEWPPDDNSDNRTRTIAWLVAHLTEAFTVGLAQATEIEAAAPFGHLVLHMNRELISHGAES